EPAFAVPGLSSVSDVEWEMAHCDAFPCPTAAARIVPDAGAMPRRIHRARASLQEISSMSKLLGLLVASLVAGGAFAQSATSNSTLSNQSGASATSSGSLSSQNSVTGPGATTGGTLGASGGAIVQPGTSAGTSSSTATQPATGSTSGTSASGATSGSTSGSTAANTNNIYLGAPGTSSSSTATATDRDTSTSRMGADRDCPPGLAKKHNGCLPPGQAKKQEPQQH
ncbi:MAG: hypothetical protein ACXWJY_09625, partial [Ramlibacter sp.]